MEKIRFKNALNDGGAGTSWDGTTLVDPTFVPTWSFTGGFFQATLPAGVGRMQASLFGKAPAADPYLMLATMWTNRSATTADIVGVDTIAPVRTRDRWVAQPGNTHVSLVRPDDTITFSQVTTGDAYLEVLLEPLANTNEFGQILMDYVREAARERSEIFGAEAELVMTGDTSLSGWAGTLRLRSTAGAGCTLLLPPANAQSLRDLLIFERDGAGNVIIDPGTVGDVINGSSSITVTTNHSVLNIRGAGTRYSSSGVL